MTSMRASILVAAPLAALLLGGCSTNVEQLRSMQAEADRRLTVRKEAADNLNERRRELDALKETLHAAEKDGLAPRRSFAQPSSSPLPREPPLIPPPESPFEGSEASRRRVQLAETQRRIAELDRIIREVDHIEEQKRDLAQKLEALTRSSRDGG